MTKRTRLIILLACIACFLAVSPILVLYSMGYRIDLEKMKISLTGGIYVRTSPTAEKIIIDSKGFSKPAIFSNSIFVQSLLPNSHTVLVQKTGYYDYYKTVDVKEKQVTKLEDILLIKKDLKFEVIEDQSKSPFNEQEKFAIKNNNLYYSNSPENSSLTETQKTTPLIKKIVSFAQQNNKIIWLGSDGFVYKSDLATVATTTPEKISLEAVKISKTGFYSIISDDKNIFINNNGVLLILKESGESKVFYESVKNAVVSPDGKSIVYSSNNNIYISKASSNWQEKDLLYKSTEKINNCLWLNNSYIIVSAGNKITISETDIRGNVNTVVLPRVADLPDNKTVEIKNPQIFFNQQEAKLYVLTDKVLLVSEKITP